MLAKANLFLKTFVYSGFDYPDPVNFYELTSSRTNDGTSEYKFMWVIIII